jgi:hypothetical protein
MIGLCLCPLAPVVEWFRVVESCHSVTSNSVLTNGIFCRTSHHAGSFSNVNTTPIVDQRVMSTIVAIAQSELCLF